MEKKKFGLLTFERYQGKKKDSIGSSRIRGYWIMKNWNPEWDIELEEFQIGKKYDGVIFQKAYWHQFLESFHGIKVMDICDADWMWWTIPVMRSVASCDAIISSTVEVVKYLGKMFDKELAVIPDRMDLEFYSEIKKHRGNARSAVWFGYEHNFPTLQSAIPALVKRRLGLIVISNGVFSIPSSLSGKIDVTNKPYNQNTVNHDIISGDIVINPKFDFGHWKFKSNNKTLSSWALGMPVAHNDKELDMFLPEEARKVEGMKRRKEIEEKWDVRISAKELYDFLNVLCKKRQ